MAQFTTIVKAPLENVWRHLIFKIENPENFVPGISDVFILEKNDNFVLRKMMECVPAQGLGKSKGALKPSF